MSGVTGMFGSIFLDVIISLSTVVLSIIGMGIVPSIIDVWGYDREFLYLVLGGLRLRKLAADDSGN